jgi:hypothetical protein
MSKKLDKIVKENIVEYKDENEFLKYNGLDKDDFNQWIIRGFSDDGLFEIFDCYSLAGDATNDNYMRITDVSQITDLLLCEIRDSDFNEIVEALNEDNPNDLTDVNTVANVVELFLEYIHEVATFPIEHGKYRGGLMLVIDED